MALSFLIQKVSFLFHFANKPFLNKLDKDILCNYSKTNDDSCIIKDSELPKNKGFKIIINFDFMQKNSLSSYFAYFLKADTEPLTGFLSLWS